MKQQAFSIPLVAQSNPVPSPFLGGFDFLASLEIVVVPELSGVKPLTTGMALVVRGPLAFQLLTHWYLGPGGGGGERCLLLAVHGAFAIGV